MHDEIALNKCITWYKFLSDTNKIKFIEYLWQTDKHKVDYASMPESLRRFYDPKAVRPSRPTHGDE